MSVDVQFDEEVYEMEVTYNERETSFRVPIACQEWDDDATVELAFRRVGGDEALRVMDADGEDVLGERLGVSSLRAGETLLEKFRAVSASGASLPDETEVELVLFVDGSVVDRVTVVFYNAIRAY